MKVLLSMTGWIGLVAGCQSESDDPAPYALSVTVGYTAESAGMSGIQAFLHGVEVVPPNSQMISEVHNSYEEALEADPIAVELFQDGVLRQSVPVRAGGPRWCGGCEGHGPLTSEQLSFPILVDMGVVYFGDGSYSCTTSTWGDECVP